MGKMSDNDSLRCSFCRKNQNAVAKLVSSPSEYPRAHICDECIGVCASILADAQAPHPLLTHPLAPGLMEAIEQWIREESSGGDVLVALLGVRAIARQMCQTNTRL
jgi:ATP-dependent Clp protease ATP-binding subunit ClpX